MLAWRPVGCSDKTGIAAAAPAALSHDDRLIRFGQIRQHRSGGLIENDGADWQADDQRFAAFSSFVIALSALSAWRCIFVLIAVIEQGANMFIRHYNDVAAIA